MTTIFQLGQSVTDAVAERALSAVIGVDPHARPHIRRLQGQLLVDTSLAADDVVDALLRAGLRVQAWSAEVPLRDGFARVSLRPRSAISR